MCEAYYVCHPSVTTSDCTRVTSCECYYSVTTSDSMRVASSACYKKVTTSKCMRVAHKNNTNVLQEVKACVWTLVNVTKM